MNPDPPAAVLQAFHARLPGFEVSVLRDCPGIARSLGVSELRVKDESRRAGLPAFKILGASWAVYQRIVEEAAWSDRADLGLSEWRHLGELAERASSVLPEAFVSATDGNHGRAVARLARWLGGAAEILVPASCPAGRVRGIEREGARVRRVSGSYQRAVEQAIERGAAPGCWLIQDVGRDGEDERVDAIVAGYATMFREVAQQWPEGPELVFVPVGVGSLARAALHARDALWPRARVVGVEPRCADALRRSIEAGALCSVDDPHATAMVTLACDAPCPRAFPALRQGMDAVITISDPEALDAVEALRAEAQDSGPSGAAATAGARRVARSPELRRALDLGPRSRILSLVTEASAAAGETAAG